jgi:DNA-binding PadR family transcriptional regulator
MPAGRQRRHGGRSRRGAWFLEPVLLLLLHQGPAHGYTLIEQLGGFGLEGLHPSVVYRALRDMDEKEWMTSSWDADETQGPPRRVYRLSAQGDEALQAHMQDLRQAHEQIGDLMDAYHRHMKEGKGEHH